MPLFSFQGPVFGKVLWCSSLLALLKHLAVAAHLCHFHSIVVADMVFFEVPDPCNGPFREANSLLLLTQLAQISA